MSVALVLGGCLGQSTPVYSSLLHSGAVYGETSLHRDVAISTKTDRWIGTFLQQIGSEGYLWVGEAKVGESTVGCLDLMRACMQA